MAVDRKADDSRRCGHDQRMAGKLVQRHRVILETRAEDRGANSGQGRYQKHGLLAKVLSRETAQTDHELRANLAAPAAGAKLRRKRLRGSAWQGRSCAVRRAAMSGGGLTLRAFVAADRDWVAASHATHYRGAEQFDAAFDRAVSAALADILGRLGRDRTAGLVLEGPEGRCGCLFLCDEAAAVARLRLFLLDPLRRGRGMAGDCWQPP